MRWPSFRKTIGPPQWVREFSMATGMADMLEEFDKVLARRG